MGDRLFIGLLLLWGTRRRYAAGILPLDNQLTCAGEPISFRLHGGSRGENLPCEFLLSCQNKGCYLMKPGCQMQPGFCSENFYQEMKDILGIWVICDGG